MTNWFRLGIKRRIEVVRSKMFKYLATAAVRLLAA